MIPAVLAATVALVFGGVMIATWRETIDRAWFLHVCRRVLYGEDLYREVFFGAGPAPVWIAVLACRVLRPQAMVLRGLALAYSTAIAIMTAFLAELATGSMAVAAAIGVTSAGLSARYTPVHNHYGLLSMLCILFGAHEVLTERWLIAGVFLGVAAASKYSIGIVAGLGFALHALWFAGFSGLAQLSVGAGAVGLIVIAILGRVGVISFVNRAVRNKSVYLRDGRISPTKDLVAAMRMQRSMVARLQPMIPYAVIALTAATMMARAPSVGAQQLAVAVWLLALAVVSWFPRADLPHVGGAMPLSFAAAGLVLPASPTWVLAAMATGALVIGAADVTHAIWNLEHPVRRDVASFRRIPVPAPAGVWPDDTADLVEATGGRVFLLHPAAPFFYAAGGLVDPTPFDYPYSTTFGPDGQGLVIAQIRAGLVEHVCVGGVIPDNFRPVELAHFVETEMSPVATCRAGVIYVFAQSSRPGGGPRTAMP